MTRKTSARRLVAMLVISFFTQVNGQTLQEAIQTTVNTSPDVLAASNGRWASEQEVRAAQAGYLPTLDANYGFGYERAHNPATRAAGLGQGYEELNRRESSVNVNQNVFSGFATKNEVSRTRAETKASAFLVLSTVENQALLTVEAYLNVLQSQREVRAAEENVKHHEQTLAMIRRRSETGISRRADLVQAEGRLALARANLESLTSAYRDSRTTFFRIVGEMPVNLAEPNIADSLIPKSEEDAVQLALENNPVLKSAYADIEATDAQHRTSLAAYYPTVDLQLAASWDDELAGVQGANNNYQAMVRGNYNLFNGGADLARDRQTAYLSKETRQNAARTYRQVIESMKLSWNALMTARARLQNLRQHKEASMETVVLYRKQFQIGQRTLLDLLDAESESFESNVAYIGGLYQLKFAKYRILDDMSVLLKEENIALPQAASMPEKPKPVFG